MTHGHRQWGGNGLWKWGTGQDKGGRRGKNWDNCNRINRNEKKEKRVMFRSIGIKRHRNKFIFKKTNQFFQYFLLNNSTILC